MLLYYVSGSDEIERRQQALNKLEIVRMPTLAFRFRFNVFVIQVLRYERSESVRLDRDSVSTRKLLYEWTTQSTRGHWAESGGLCVYGAQL